MKQLSLPERYPGEPEKVNIIQTHISVVCIAGDDVYKLKKPVKLPFLDFSTRALTRISHRHLSIRRKWVLRAMVRHGWDEQGTTVKLRAGFRGIVDSKWPSFGGNRCD
jgi:hypothetical protein